MTLSNFNISLNTAITSVSTHLRMIPFSTAPDGVHRQPHWNSLSTQWLLRPGAQSQDQPAIRHRDQNSNLASHWYQSSVNQKQFVNYTRIKMSAGSGCSTEQTMVKINGLNEYRGRDTTRLAAWSKRDFEISDLIAWINGDFDMLQSELAIQV